MNYKLTPTHRRLPVKGRRGSPVKAQLLSIANGIALVRIGFKAGKDFIVRHTSFTSERFERDFEAVA